MKSLGILWAQFGPYHFARARALQLRARPASVFALEQANLSRDYGWDRTAAGINVTTLCPDSYAEELSFGAAFRSARSAMARLGLEVCLLPSYSPKQSLAALLAAKSLGVRTVMMNETHAGTARARGLSRLVKRQLVRLFDAALVGGGPQKRYFASLGLPEEKIFTGYDAVDNDFFAEAAERARASDTEHRLRLGLPNRYFLNLGRFVPKKNLAVLIRAFQKFLATAPRETHLVLVGSGSQETALRSLCAELSLPVYEHARTNSPGADFRISPPGVHFFGFRQLKENPAFYALAEAFILPSLWEEWGLVVNEAMAAGLPVVVSETAGCAEDLLELGLPPTPERISTETTRRLEMNNLTHRVRRNGFVFSPESVDELSGILASLESDIEMRKAMGQAGRRIVDKFSCQKFAENALLAARVALGERPVPSVIPACETHPG